MSNYSYDIHNFQQQHDKALFVYNPEGLNISIVPPNLADSCRCFLHIMEQRRWLEDKEEDEYIFLNARLLQAQLGWKNVIPCRNALLHAGVIAWDRRYAVQTKSYGFKLLPPYCEQRFRKVKLQDSLVRQRFQRNLDKFDIVLRNDVQRRLFRWLCEVRLHESAWRELHLLVDPEQEARRYWHKDLELQKIMDQQWYFHSDARGRIYHPIVNLWKPLRKYLRLQGEHLVGLDIANSQPLLFCLLLNKNLASLTRNNNNTGGQGDTPRNDTHLSLSAIQYEYKAYTALCENGLFYEAIMDDLGVPLNERSEFKIRAFKEVYYCKPGYRTKAKKAFRARFPNVLALLDAMKAKNKNKAALTMQRTEADFIYNKVCKRLMEESPHIPLLTIHDSILTTPNYAKQVKQVMLDEFAQVGLCPTIKQEDYSKPAKPSNSFQESFGSEKRIYLHGRLAMA